MKNGIVIPAEVVAQRMFQANVFEFSYKNPFMLAYLYYTEGMSTVELANLLGCEQRTIRRYMNYYGMRRFEKGFSQLVKAHGVQKAMQLQAPKFYPLGRYDD